MRMNLEGLLALGRIRNVEKTQFDPALAERDLTAAQNSLSSGDCDWALSIAYNSALQAGRGLMFHMGFRPAGTEAHKAVFEFLLAIGFEPEITSYFDRMRRKRHIAVYDRVQTVSRSEAEECIDQAILFVQKIRTFVQKIRTVSEDAGT